MAEVEPLKFNFAKRLPPAAVRLALVRLTRSVDLTGQAGHALADLVQDRVDVPLVAVRQAIKERQADLRSSHIPGDEQNADDLDQVLESLGAAFDEASKEPEARRADAARKARSRPGSSELSPSASALIQRAVDAGGCATSMSMPDYLAAEAGVVGTPTSGYNSFATGFQNPAYGDSARTPPGGNGAGQAEFLRPGVRSRGTLNQGQVERCAAVVEIFPLEYRRSERVVSTGFLGRKTVSFKNSVTPLSLESTLGNGSSGPAFAVALTLKAPSGYGLQDHTGRFGETTVSVVVDKHTALDLSNLMKQEPKAFYELFRQGAAHAVGEPVFSQVWENGFDEQEGHRVPAWRESVEAHKNNPRHAVAVLEYPGFAEVPTLAGSKFAPVVTVPALGINVGAEL